MHGRFDQAIGLVSSNSNGLRPGITWNKNLKFGFGLLCSDKFVKHWPALRFDLVNIWLLWTGVTWCSFWRQLFCRGMLITHTCSTFKFHCMIECELTASINVHTGMITLYTKTMWYPCAMFALLAAAVTFQQTVADWGAAATAGAGRLRKWMIHEWSEFSIKVATLNS